MCMTWSTRLNRYWRWSWPVLHRLKRFETSIENLGYRVKFPRNEMRLPALHTQKVKRRLPALIGQMPACSTKSGERNAQFFNLLDRNTMGKEKIKSITLPNPWGLPRYRLYLNKETPFFFTYLLYMPLIIYCSYIVKWRIKLHDGRKTGMQYFIPKASNMGKVGVGEKRICQTRLQVHEDLVS